MICNQPK